MEDLCTECGRLPTIFGTPETVILKMEDGKVTFKHGICDERWDLPAPSSDTSDTRPVVL